MKGHHFQKLPSFCQGGCYSAIVWSTVGYVRMFSVSSASRPDRPTRKSTVWSNFNVLSKPEDSSNVEKNSPAWDVQKPPKFIPPQIG